MQPVKNVQSHRRCVNPAHLFLGTQADNMADMVAKGRNRPGELRYNSKLTAAIVQEIRSRYKGGDISQYELARMFQVSQGVVFRIIHYKTWKHI
jgi:hypothetical protein